MDLMRKKGYKDLEITFVGMAFIIQGALQVIQSAVSTVVQIEKPPLLWIIMVLFFHYCIVVICNSNHMHISLINGFSRGRYSNRINSGKPSKATSNPFISTTRSC